MLLTNRVTLSKSLAFHMTDLSKSLALSSRLEPPHTLAEGLGSSREAQDTLRTSSSPYRVAVPGFSFYKSY